MRHKLYAFTVAFLLFSLVSISQSPLGKEVKPYFGQTGIKKKISELQAVKPPDRKSLDTSNISPLRFRLKKFSNFTKPEREGYVVGGTGQERENDREDKKALRSSVSAGSTSATQQIWSNFLSIDFYDNPRGWPPDPTGDIGASQVIVSTNIGIKVFTKTGVTDLPLETPKGYSGEKAPSTLFLTLEQFFSPVLLSTSFIGDPHIRYDRLTKRWFVIAADFQNNLSLLAVSDGDRVTDSSSFTFYSYKANIFQYNHNAPYVPFYDYPMLGIDKNSVLIGANLFFFSNNGFDSVNFIGYVIDKKKLIKGNLTIYPFKLGNETNDEAHGVIVPQAVQNDDPDAKKSFFVGLNANNDGLVVANIEYDKKNKPRRAHDNTVPVERWNFPRDNSSPGGLTPIDQLDTRLFAAAIYKNKFTGTSSLWTAHAIGVNKSGTYINGSDSDFVREARTGSRWYKIGNIYTKPRIFQSGTIYDSAQPSGRRAVQYFNPSIAASGQGHSIISGTTDAFNEYLNVFAAGRYYGDGLGTSRPPVKATNTTAIYAPYVDYGGGYHAYVGRWGDYSQTVVDPLDDQTIWTFQEYANVDDSYGVRAVQFKAPPPATPPFFIGSFFSDTTIILEGTSVDNSGFFDPGEDKGGPGYNRLSVKSTGDIIVSNIKFISPTKISFRLNLKNKPFGPNLLIITNPDGQVTVTSYFVLGSKNISSAARPLDNKTAQNYITESTVFPNPTTGNATLQINAAKEHIAKIVLVGVNGKQVFEKSFSFSKGSNQAVLPIEKFTKGTYIAAVYNADNVLIATQKIIKQ